MKGWAKLMKPNMCAKQWASSHKARPTRAENASLVLAIKITTHSISPRDIHRVRD